MFKYLLSHLRTNTSKNGDKDNQLGQTIYDSKSYYTAHCRLYWAGLALSVINLIPENKWTRMATNAYLNNEVSERYVSFISINLFLNNVNNVKVQILD